MPSIDAPSAEANKEAPSLDLNLELRRVLNQSIGAVLGRQATESFYALTYEELADQQIERIEGNGSSTRPNELERVNKIESDLLSAVEQIRNIPPENFLLADPTRDVNTPIDPAG